MPGPNPLISVFRTSARPAFRASSQWRSPMLLARRRVQTVAETGVENDSALMKLWKSPVGPKTVHFW